MNQETAISLPPVAQMVESVTMGGAENLAVRIANAMAERGHPSHLIVLGERGILSERVATGVKAHYLGFQRESINRPLAFLGSLRRGHRLLDGLLKEEGIAVTQTHLPGSNFWGLLLAMFGDHRVLATIHNNAEFKYGDHDNALRAFLRKQAYRSILSRCSGTVAVSEEVRTSLIRDLGVKGGAGDRISVVTNGVVVPDTLPEPDVLALRESVGVQEGQVFILAAGRLSDQKNFADLIRAAGILRDKNPGFRLVICGEGEHRAALEEQITTSGLEEHVALPGNRTDLNRLMQAADVFAMSSLWEGLPLVLLEAMAAGLPPVGYAIKGIDEILTEGQTGLIVPVGEPAGLAQGMARLVQGADERRRLGDAARNLVTERYNFSTLVDRLSSLYGQVVTPRIRN